MIGTSFGSRYRCVFTLLAAGAVISACGGGGSGDSQATATPTPPPPTVSSENKAPTIQGQPASEAIVGEPYSFQPAASDPDQDLVSFTIANKPTWATFDTAKGLLSGTPEAKDAGGYSNIEIAATDGKIVTTLPAFTLTVNAAGTTAEAVTIAWAPPTENTDGTALTDLSGYKIHYGSESKTYSSSVAVKNPSLTRFVLESLPAGKYYFALTATNGAGHDSPFSQEVAATLN
jgi:hypothetical protein